MCQNLKAVIFLNIFIFEYIFAAPSVSFVPMDSKSEEAEKKLNHFLGKFYDNVIKNNLTRNTSNDHLERYSENDDIYDTMQGDQPVAENSINQNTQQISRNFTYQVDTKLPDVEYRKAMRNM